MDFILENHYGSTDGFPLDAVARKNLEITKADLTEVYLREREYVYVFDFSDVKYLQRLKQPN